MQKQKILPGQVANAIVSGDTERLHDFGKRGAERKRQQRQFRINRLVREAEWVAFQANEHICPVDN